MKDQKEDTENEISCYSELPHFEVFQRNEEESEEVKGKLLGSSNSNHTQFHSVLTETLKDIKEI